MMKLNDEYLALTARLAHDVKVASYSRLGLRPGSRHLEIGSGNGHDSIALAELEPGAQITGIDLNGEIVAVANARVKERSLDNIIHLAGDATAMDLGTRFHSMRAERVLQHLDDNQIHALAANLARHAEPGCVFSMVGADWETLTCTVPKQHRETFGAIKQALIAASNSTCVHSTIAAFEDAGFVTDHIDTWNITTFNFTVAMLVLNLEKVAALVNLDERQLQTMHDSFLADKHYLCLGGCTANFVFRG